MNILSMVRNILQFSIIISLLLSGCSQELTTPLRIGTNVWPGYEPLYLAQKMGMYGNGLVELLELPSTTEVIRSYRNGMIDGAGVTLDEALLLAEYQMDFSILLITDYSHGGDVILARPPITSLDMIRNHNVGLENTALGAYVISRALEIGNIKPNEITIVPLYIDEHENAYDTHKIDVIVTFDPIRTKLLEKGANIIFDSTQIPKEIVDVLIVRNHFLQKNPEAAQKLLHGWFFAINHIEKYPDDSYATMARRLGISAEETKNAYAHLLLASLAENKTMLFGNPPPLLATAKRLADKMLTANILGKKKDYQALFISKEKMRLYP